MSKVTMWRSRWRCVIKPAYSFSFLLSINIFIWQNVLYLLDAPRINRPTRCTFCVYLFYNLCTTLHVSNDYFAHHQEFINLLYLQLCTNHANVSNCCSVLRLELVPTVSSNRKTKKSFVSPCPETVLQKECMHREGEDIRPYQNHVNYWRHILEQCFSVGGTLTTGGVRRAVCWYSTLFGNYNVFHNSISKMLIALINCFNIFKWKEDTYNVFKRLN